MLGVLRYGVCYVGTADYYDRCVEGLRGVPILHGIAVYITL